MGRLDGKVVLITGGARGMGAAEARRFVREGARVAITDVRDEEGQALADSLGEKNALFLHQDVAEGDAWPAVVAKVEEVFGRLDGLVNNAGFGLPARLIDEASAEEHRRIIDVNLHGVWYGVRSATPALRRAGGGSIVNISSIDGLSGVEGMSSYVASKFAVTGMTRTAALDLGRYNIRVNSVHPGVIATDLILDVPPDVEARVQRMIDRQPLKRMGTPEEVALLVLYLISDESAFCTGGQFLIDGGHIAGPHRDGL